MSKFFMINIIKGSSCSICNSINLHWNNSVEQHNPMHSKDNSLECVLPLYKFINMFGKHMNNAHINFKKSKLKLNIKSINCLNYLRINLYDTHDNCNINDLIENDIMIISFNTSYYNNHKIQNDYNNNQKIQNHPFNEHNKYNDQFNHNNCSNCENYIFNNYNNYKDHNYFYERNTSNKDHHNNIYENYMNNNICNKNICYKRKNILSTNMYNKKNNCFHSNNCNCNCNYNCNCHDNKHVNYHINNMNDHTNSHMNNMNNHINSHSVEIISCDNQKSNDLPYKNTFCIGILLPYKSHTITPKILNHVISIFKNNTCKLNRDIKFIFNVYEISFDENILSYIENLHKKYCIDAFICGQVSNNDLVSIKNYIETHNLLLLLFGMNIVKDNLSKNILCLSPTQDKQVITMAKYIKNINNEKKYIITCSNNFVDSTKLVNELKFELNSDSNIILDSSISYDLDKPYMEDIFNKIKLQINIALNKGIPIDNIYLYYVSSTEIIEFIKYLINNDTNKLLESINWIGADTNYLIFDNSDSDSDSDSDSCNDLSNNNITNDIRKVKLYLASINFITLVHNSSYSEENIKIINEITDHPSSLEMYDALWILINGFFISRSYDNNKIDKIILNISDRQFGLTGNLALNSCGARKYYKYVVKQASFKNNTFYWKNIANYDNISK
jgi:hypothetical protein